ncbi:hypothetical protein [Moritella viscosa]|uniref:hypothetical protein n=1 Tax=Moritella viscosa TaxID=80854 RepID=UPI000697D79A|nr:hypothetical protein [Moritella viscosa]
MSAGLKRCLEALERMKQNTPLVSKFKDLPRDRVTLSVISQEAGFDSGYLKNGREQHTNIINLIETFKNSSGCESPGSTLSVKERISREHNKVVDLQHQLADARFKLSKALERETLLLDYIANLEINNSTKKVSILNIFNDEKA